MAAAGPAPVGIQVEGAREVRRALRKMGADVHGLRAMHQAVGELMVPLVAAAVRRRSGALAASFVIRATTAKAVIGSKLVYAPVQEFGWDRHHIRPSLAVYRTVEAHRDQVAEHYQRAIGVIVDKAQTTYTAGLP